MNRPFCRVWILATMLLLGMQSLSHAGTQQTRVRPSLDVLVARADAYWRLLAQGRKVQAAEYVRADCRAAFLAGKHPSFRAPRLARLEPAASGAEVSVTMNVKRSLPPLQGEFEWPVTNRWVFSRGSWYVVIEDGVLPLYSESQGARGTPPGSAEVEKQRARIRAGLRFEKNEFDFGTVKRGTPVPVVLLYQLEGDQSLDLEFKNAPPDLILNSQTERKLFPAKTGKFEMQLITANYDGEVNERFTLLVGPRGIDVPYEFTLHGRVYAPVSLIPRVLRFLKDERQKEVEIRNNSSSELRIDSVESDTAGFEVKPLPQSLSPGARCVLTVTALLQNPGKNQTEELSLKLASPVEGLNSLDLRVILNSEERKVKPLTDMTPKEAEEWLRKNRSNPIKP